MTFEYPQEIINDLEKLLENEEGYDVIIYTGENENVKEIHAHSVILRTRSQYFRAAFSNEWAEKRDGKFIFKKPNISTQFFKIILRFLYCGKVDLTKLQGPDTLKLLIAADELNIQTLILCIQEHLVKHQYEFLQQNPIGILETVYQRESFTEILDYCLEKVCEEPEILFNSDKFISLKTPLLESFLKRDDLCLDEIVIWDSLVKWSLAQHPSIQNDVKKWNKEEITIVGRTIHRFIPLIRFYEISSEDFLFKVYPFKALLPEDLVINVLASHMAPNKKLNIEIQPPRQSKNVYDSVLIKSQHFAIFSSWIDKKENLHYNRKRNPYKFDLLYRASRDGNTVAAFHQKCDNKGATIFIAKIKNSEQIIGGYNPLYWDQSGAYKLTYDSFLFSFVNRTNLQTAKVGYIINNQAQYAIYCHPSYGPRFGGGCDIYCINNNTWGSSHPHTYSQIDIPNGQFQVDDYEVFQVTKK